MRDPEIFTAAIITIFNNFPESVLLAVCNPVSGLPSQLKWVPTPSEILTACKDRLRHEQTIERYAAMKPEPRPRWTKNPGTVGDGSPGTVYANYEEAFAKHGRPTGPFEQGRELPYGAQRDD